jgi:hypothetical protein
MLIRFYTTVTVKYIMKIGTQMIYKSFHTRKKTIIIFENDFVKF